MSRFGLILAGIIGLSMQSLDAAPAKNNSGEHRFHGTIVAVHNKGGKHSITIHTRHRKNGQTAAAGKNDTRTFIVDQNTKIEVGGKNQLRPASLAALHKGEHVVVLARHHHADAVIIHHKKKKVA